MVEAQYGYLISKDEFELVLFDFLKKDGGGLLIRDIKGDDKVYIKTRGDKRTLVFDSVSFVRVDLKTIKNSLRVRNIVFNNCIFAQCHFEDITFLDCRFIGCHFRYCYLSNVHWYHGIIKNTKFAFTKIEDYSLYRVYFKENVFYTTSMTSGELECNYIEKSRLLNIHSENSVFSMYLNGTKIENSYFEESRISLESSENVLKDCKFYVCTTDFQANKDVEFKEINCDFIECNRCEWCNME